MFGIGLPEFILIMALALIVVGPEKLPDLAKSLAKQLLELKKTANALKDSLQGELREAERASEERDRLQPGAVAALPAEEKGEDKKNSGDAPVIDVEALPAKTVGRSVAKAAAAEDAAVRAPQVEKKN
jgi:Tat protein translocase TatB subunit